MRSVMREICTGALPESLALTLNSSISDFVFSFVNGMGDIIADFLRSGAVFFQLPGKVRQGAEGLLVPQFAEEPDLEGLAVKVPGKNKKVGLENHLLRPPCHGGPGPRIGHPTPDFAASRDLGRHGEYARGD